MADKQGVPLTSIDGFDAGAAERLATLWITTAEELVSAAKQEGGLEGLTELLEMPEGGVAALVDMAVNALPPEVSFAPGSKGRDSDWDSAGNAVCVSGASPGTSRVTEL